MKKTFLWLVLLLVAVIIAATGMVWAQSSDYSDVDPWDWFRETVVSASDRGIVSGYPDGTFRPEKSVTYGEFLAMALFADELDTPPATGHWAAIYYNTALEKGCFSAADFTAAQLDEVIPRKHMALLLASLAKNHDLTENHGLTENYELRENQTWLEESPFSDLGEDHCYGDSIALCASLGLLSGYPDGSFRPDAGLKRCEAAAPIMNYAALLDQVWGDGNEVVLLYNSGNYLVKEKDGQYCLTDGGSLFSPVEAPDKQKNIHPSKLIRSDQKALLDQILASTTIQKGSGFYTFSYSQPEIDDGYHLAVDLHIYKDNSQGGSDVVFYYTSDAGWMSDPGKYSGEQQTISMKIPVTRLEDKAIVLRYLLSDLEDPALHKLGECGEYCYFIDGGVTTLFTRASRYYNGSMTKYQITDVVDSCPVFSK